MVSSNITLHNVQAARFRKLLEKYTTHPIIANSTLIKNYVASCYQDTINKMSSCAGKKKTKYGPPYMKPMTNDVDGRFVANKHEESGKILLLACEVLERVNKFSIAVVSQNAINLPWPGKVELQAFLIMYLQVCPIT
jgi:hypothetical protein